MAARPTTCLSESVLSDFGLGKLDAASADSVSQHIETCADCRQRVASLSGDSFVGRLRQAGDAGRERTYAPGESLANAASSTDGSSKEDGLPRPSRSSDDRRDGRGSPSSLSAPPELANHPDYELVKELGQGGMGTVYLAKNRMMDRLEVLKVISKSLLDRPGALERFQQEIRSAAKLQHPNIVAAYSVLRPGELLVFAMEYVRGQDLSEVVAHRGPLPVANAAFYIHQVANGLQHACEKGMVHRDIKPNNLMLAVEGKKHIVKILDFGLAKATSEKGAETGLTKSGQMLGTPDYVAPEQTLDAQKADIRADIYSLGCTLYFLLSGGPPFQETSLYEILEAHHTREPKPLNLVRPEVPVELPAVVSKMVAKKPEDRYQTPLEVAKALVPFFKPGQSVVMPPKVAQPQPPTSAETEYRIAGITPTQPMTPAAALPSIALNPIPVASVAPQRMPAAAEGFSVAIDTRRPTAEQRGWWSSSPPWRRWVLAVGPAAPAVILGIVLLVRTSQKQTGKRDDDAFLANNGAKGSVKTASRGAANDGAKGGVQTTSRGATIKRFPCEILNPSHAQWSIDGDELVQSSRLADMTILFGDRSWQDFDLSAEAKLVEGNDACGFYFDYEDVANWKSYAVAVYRNTTHWVMSKRQGNAVIDDQRQGSVVPGRWYRLEIRVRAMQVSCFLDSERILGFEPESRCAGRLGLSTWESAYRFRKIVVKAPDGTVLLEGLPNVDQARNSSNSTAMSPNTSGGP